MKTIYGRFRVGGAGYSPGVPLLALFLGVCLLGGGASRADVESQLAVRAAGLILLGVALFLPKLDLRAIRAPLCFMAALALLILIQLMPLPPALWTMLPGRGFFVDAAGAAGVAQPWRPLNLTPDLGWNSLLALVPPTAALIGAAALTRDERLGLLPVLIGLALFSALWGIAQISAGPNSPLYTYEITNRALPVGMFANRNHQAALLAMTLPMLALWGRLRASGWRYGIAVTLGIMLLPLILVTGSRAGLGLALLGLLFGYLLLYAPSRSGRTAVRRAFDARSRVAALLPVLLAALVVALTIMLARAAALQRLLDVKLGGDTRLELFRPLLRIAIDYMPFGSGFGSFNAIYRHHEAFDALSFTYLNHAHNDLLELAIEAGLPGVLLAAGFVAWWARRSFLVWRARANGSRAVLFGRLGSAMILILLLASLPDYPLRTPMLGVIFAVACVWLADYSAKRA
ncbi:MAG TPA: O-antigen ligase family protein [Sphingomonadaceae bacterium]|nr:O-antigen ligase family protein [Sphingomonadaceae bacterium]